MPLVIENGAVEVHHFAGDMPSGHGTATVRHPMPQQSKMEHAVGRFWPLNRYTLFARKLNTRQQDFIILMAKQTVFAAGD